MNLEALEEVKGFMPYHEGEALSKWAEEFSNKGPIMEIGTYCGKSSLFLSYGANKNNQLVFTVDHHNGSEEHQIDEEYFDNEIYDTETNLVNSFPLFVKNINRFRASNVVPIVRNSVDAAKTWDAYLGMVFIDGGHALETAMQDFNSWNEKIISGGALVIHDIFEKPEDGGQAPFIVYQHALKNGFSDFERVDTIICLKKS